ncbi:MAG: DJ-1/PfpI family protein [Verrucomicrobiota bacterium]|nr:DJ-1/PfpI family protein [Verrucomicrobiota bacterium]
MEQEKTRTVGILLFDDVEVMDFAGPFEVFSVAGRTRNAAPFRVFTCAEKSEPVLARNQLSVNPAYELSQSPPIDILVIPGGWGTRMQLKNAQLLSWIRATAKNCELVLSVCTGSLLLGQAGLLTGLEATTHHAAMTELRNTHTQIQVLENRRFVDTGKIITSGGIAAGIDMSLHVVARLLGEETAREAADYMEYPWTA